MISSSNLCRLCASSMKKDGTDLFSDQPSSYLEIIRNYFNLKLLNEETVPSKVCSNCTFELDNIIAFKEKCLHTQNSFSRMFNKIHFEMIPENEPSQPSNVSSPSVADSSKTSENAQETRPINTIQSVPNQFVSVNSDVNQLPVQHQNSNMNNVIFSNQPYMQFQNPNISTDMNIQPQMSLNNGNVQYHPMINQYVVVNQPTVQNQCGPSNLYHQSLVQNIVSPNNFNPPIVNGDTTSGYTNFNNGNLVNSTNTIIKPVVSVENVSNLSSNSNIQNEIVCNSDNGGEFGDSNKANEESDILSFKNEDNDEQNDSDDYSNVDDCNDDNGSIVNDNFDGNVTVELVKKIKKEKLDNLEDFSSIKCDDGNTSNLSFDIKKLVQPPEELIVGPQIDDFLIQALQKTEYDNSVIKQTEKNKADIKSKLLNTDKSNYKNLQLKESLVVITDNLRRNSVTNNENHRTNCNTVIPITKNYNSEKQQTPIDTNEPNNKNIKTYQDFFDYYKRIAAFNFHEKHNKKKNFEHLVDVLTRPRNNLPIVPAGRDLNSLRNPGYMQPRLNTPKPSSSVQTNTSTNKEKINYPASFVIEKTSPSRPGTSGYKRKNNSFCNDDENDPDYSPFTNKRLQCPICDKDFNKKYRLTSHMKLHNTKEVAEDSVDIHVID